MATFDCVALRGQCRAGNRGGQHRILTVQNLPRATLGHGICGGCQDLRKTCLSRGAQNPDQNRAHLGLHTGRNCPSQKDTQHEEQSFPHAQPPERWIKRAQSPNEPATGSAFPSIAPGRGLVADGRNLPPTSSDAGSNPAFDIVAIK